jgi:outer membrane protein TolC
MSFRLLFLLSSSLVIAETRTMTLAQVLQAAGEQSPELALARLDEKKAAEATKAAHDPFRPKLFAGSGLAYSSGFPLSIEGSAPSILESRAIASVFNRPQRLMIDKAKQDEKTVRIGTEMKRDELAYRVAALYLEAGRLAAAARSVRLQTENLEQVEKSVNARVAEGRELPIESRRAALRVAQSRQRAVQLDLSRGEAETQLALAAGLPAGDRIEPAEPEAPIRAAIDSEDAAIAAAIGSSNEVRRLESMLAAAALESRSHAAAALPRVDLVAQYGLFARFNNYDKFFNRFQRHNGQFGVSFQVPLFPSAAAKAQRATADVESSRLRAQINMERARITARTRKAWMEVKAYESNVEVARMDLDVAREQTSLLLALQEEGRVTQKQLEESRYLENEKWMLLFDARYTADRARLDLLRETGTVLSSLRN